jgi:hypothetical protein
MLEKVLLFFRAEKYGIILLKLTSYFGARGSVVVEALCYKQEGSGFEAR